MNYERIFELIAKGLSVAEALLEAGQVALPAIKAVQSIVDGSRQGGKVTDEELDATQAQLDEMIAEFNLELPE
jgi:hypothetical protein